MNIERAVIEINGGCNYSCTMCPQSVGRTKSFLRKMPLTQFEDIVSQCAEHGVKVVNLEGSGEPTLNRDLAKYVEVVKRYGMKAFIFSNGFRMSGTLMKDTIDAGLDYFRFSVIGYDHETYLRWMNSRYFDKVLKNIKETKVYIDSTQSQCVLATYHLILNNDNTCAEVEKYKAIAESLKVNTEIWKMHNWSGVYDPEYQRQGRKKTCGRPFAPDIVIRAGGIGDKTGAVHPCCQVLGRDEEAVLGHLSEQTMAEVWNGDVYNDLRKAHELEEYPSYCQNCDFLVDDSSVLVYTNYDRSLYHMHGTSFSLNTYRHK